MSQDRINVTGSEQKHCNQHFLVDVLNEVCSTRTVVNPDQGHLRGLRNTASPYSGCSCMYNSIYTSVEASILKSPNEELQQMWTDGDTLVLCKVTVAEP